jgi:hypothetical protein
MTETEIGIEMEYYNQEILPDGDREPLCMYLDGLRESVKSGLVPKMEFYKMIRHIRLTDDVYERVN